MTEVPEFPTNIKTIPNGLFKGCTGLKSADLRDHITSIGDYAFDGCTSVSTIKNMPSNFTRIGRFAFRNCSLEVLLLQNAKVISDYAFDNCSKLSIVDLDSKVDSIGSYAFNNCSKIVYLHSLRQIPINIYPSVFNGVIQQNANLYVGSGLGSVYNSKPVWTDFKIIDQSGTYYAKRRFALDDDDFTAVDFIENDSPIEGDIYTLQGVKVTNPKTGIYIVNGKKVIIK